MVVPPIWDPLAIALTPWQLCNGEMVVMVQATSHKCIDTAVITNGLHNPGDHPD